jgi:Zn-dependent metalloprotease
MNTIQQHHVCGVMPPHILGRVAQHSGDAGDDARSTLRQMRELALDRTRSFVAAAPVIGPSAAAPKKRFSVYDAQHHVHLPGKLVMSEHKARSSDVEVDEAYDGSVATVDFYSQVFNRNSIDDRGMRIDSTVHYSVRFDNAMWNGRQMVYGDGDGRLFRRFTASIDVIGHELTHGVTQYAAALGYADESGALNEHISDAFGIMVKQFTRRQPARESDWLIGAELFTPAVKGKAVRSMAAPGTAYDDPVLGRDPQPAHMRDYVDTDDDNGGVHINSGIPNHAFYLAAIELGGNSWEVLGRIWYATVIQRLTSDADFDDFARATTDIAGEMYGNGGRVQKIVADAWSSVGLIVPLLTGGARHSSHTSSHTRPADRPPAQTAAAKSRGRRAR